MKIPLIYILILLSFITYGQSPLPMAAVEGRQELSMSDVSGRTSEGVYRYYAQGASEPFTGVLYASHDNGNVSSWQEYIDGIGQGKWINYYENGHYKEIGHYEQNRVEGAIQKFHPNGALSAEGNYKEWRIKIGEWKYYDEDGKLMKTVDYGKKGSIEEVQEYYDRGEISYSWYSSILSQNGF